MKKPKRTDRENVSLAKAEIELANTKEVQIPMPNATHRTRNTNRHLGLSSCRP